MSERNLDRADLSAKELEVRVEHGGYAGVARLRRVGREALKWQISILTANDREICNWEGPDVRGEGNVIMTIQDIENAQHEINRAIEQFIWDPMSQS